MNNKNGIFKSALVLVLIFAVFALALTGINTFTAPIIESNGSAQELAPLFGVMPEAQGFELVYDAASPEASALADVPATVQSIYSETSGLGYVLRLSTTQGYTGDPIEITFAVDAEGKISGVQLDAYPETKDFGADYPATYLGQDSALSDVSLVAGVTYSSSAFKNAVTDGFNALIANDLVGAGVKGDDQILRELMTSVFTGMANSEGVAQYEEMEISGGQYIQAGMQALNGGGYAYIVKDGDNSYLAVCNAASAVKIFDLEGSDVTAAAAPGIAEEVAAASAFDAFADKDIKKFSKLSSESAEITALPLDDVFSTVTGAYLINDGGATYYGFVSRPYGYSNLPMVVYYMLDENGAIAAMDCDELILIAEYFTDYVLDEPAYKAGFAGLTGDSWTGEQALISGATVSSNAVKTATSDVFAAFQIIMENGGVSE